MARHWDRGSEPDAWHGQREVPTHGVGLACIHMELQERWLTGLAIARGTFESVGRQLEVHLSRGIHEGRLPPGCPLPSTRRIARRAPIHRNTVAAAYRRLAERGLVTVRRGRVARVVRTPRPSLTQELRPRIRRADVLPLEPAVRRVAVVADGKRHRAALTAGLGSRLGRTAEVIPMAPKTALEGPGRLAGLIPLVELPYLARLRSAHPPEVPFVRLRYAPLAPVLDPERRVPKRLPLVAVLTSSPRVRDEIRVLAAGREDVEILVLGEDEPRPVLDAAVAEAEQVWTDWARREETGWGPGTTPAHVDLLPLVAGITVRELHRLILPKPKS